MAMREKQLGQLGMRTNDKGQVFIKQLNDIHLLSNNNRNVELFKTLFELFANKIDIMIQIRIEEPGLESKKFVTDE